jgi:hypothetical protein
MEQKLFFQILLNHESIIRVMMVGENGPRELERMLGSDKSRYCLERFEPTF